MIWARRLLGLVLLVQLGLWARQLSYFFSDQGPLSRVVVLQCVPASSQGISVHMLSGSVVFQGLLFGLATTAALAMFSRRLGRQASALSWFLTLSAMHRAPHASGSGTMLLSLALLWCALAKDDEDVRGRPVGWALLLQICLTTALTARSGVLADSLAWPGYVAPWLLWTRQARWVAVGMALTVIFYLVAMVQGLGPLVGAVALALLPACWPLRAAAEERWQTRDRVALLVLALSLGATASRLWGAAFPAAARPLADAFALQQAQEMQNGPVPDWETRLVFPDGSWLAWQESDWLVRRHLLRVRANPVLARAYLAYRVLQSPRPGAVRLELYRVSPGVRQLEGNWLIPVVSRQEGPETRPKSVTP